MVVHHLLEENLEEVFEATLDLGVEQEDGSDQVDLVWGGGGDVTWSRY